jgi:biopolymer transport protein ExbB
MNEEFSLQQFFILGGIFMWPLLVFSIATLGLILERIAYIAVHDLSVVKLKGEVLDLINQGNAEGAKSFLRTQSRRKSAAPIFLSCLESASLGEHRMEKAVEAEAGERIRKLENGFQLLQALASLSPLTGFLGTVSGMIAAFRSIANASAVNAQLVANGIYEALITTVFGLIIAIVAITGYNLFAHIVDKFAGEMEKAASDLIEATLRSAETGK